MADYPTEEEYLEEERKAIMQFDGKINLEDYCENHVEVFAQPSPASVEAFVHAFMELIPETLEYLNQCYRHWDLEGGNFINPRAGLKLARHIESLEDFYARYQKAFEGKVNNQIKEKS